MVTICHVEEQRSPEDILRDVLHREVNDRRAYEATGRGVAWRPLRHQVPPPPPWFGWLLLAGRGAGKTAACARYVVDHVNGPPCIPGDVPHWIGIVAPTLGDAATACFLGPSGIRSFNPEAVMQQAVGGLVIKWPNGSQAKMFGAREPDDVERLRAGGNTCLIWMEELAAWRQMQDAYDQVQFGLRLGANPRWIGSTTPKPRPLIKKLVKGGVKNVIRTHATTDDNPHLPVHIREALFEAYDGTAIGAQELRGALIEQDPNALFTREKIEENRISIDDAPPFTKIEVGVDPSGGAGEQGIVVVGGLRQYSKGGVIKSGFTLADYSGVRTPEGWGRAAVEAAVEWDANAIIVETNFGGDMATATIYAAAEKLGVHIPVRTTHASRGKQPRAQPVSAMSAQNRWKFAGVFEPLEDQLCTWTTDMDWSPDRMDAMVWPAWHMKLVSTILHSVGTFGGSQMSRRTLTGRPR